MMNKLKKCLSCCIQSWIITIIMWFLWFLLACLQIWCGVSDFKIHEFRPTSKIFVISMIALSVVIFFYEKLKNWSTEYLNNSKNDEKDNKIKFLRETLLDKDRSYLKEQICDMFITLGYTMTERICIYSISDCKTHFECTVRYSDNPQFNEYSERKQYPLENGIIGKVWRDGMSNGWIHDSNIPIKGSNKKTKKAYFDYLLKEYQIPKNIAEKLRMNPVDIIAEVIRDHKNEAVAVIIFESSQKNKIDANKIQKTYNGIIKNRIVRTLENIKKPQILGNNALEENM